MQLDMAWRIRVILILIKFNIFLCNGMERKVHTSDVCTYLVSDNEDITAPGNAGGKELEELTCCATGNCSSYSIADALTTSSSYTVINITANVLLNARVNLENIENITIIGHRNPTVKCNGVGSVRFVSCNNVTIEGINWESCGSKNMSGIRIDNSSHIKIQDCLFHNSTGQAVALMNALGHVYINNCQFAHNNHYRGHGTAVYYSSEYVPALLVISKCNFTLNGAAESIIMIIKPSSKHQSHSIFSLHNSAFIQNHGIPIYILHTTLQFHGGIFFKDNHAKSGGGIFGSSSFVSFDDKCIIQFYNNSVQMDGGAIYLNNSTIHFGIASEATFIENNAQRDGGAIFAENKSNILLYANSTVKFIDNKAKAGGAIAVYGFSSLIFGDHTKVKFNVSFAITGGAIIVFHSQVSFLDNSSVIFCNGNATDGGALFGFNSHVIYNGSSHVVFTDNFATQGGALLGYFCYIRFYGNTMTSFIENNAKHGGALSAYHSNVFFNGNSFVRFSENKASIGGALHFTFQCNNPSDKSSALNLMFDQYNIPGSDTLEYSVRFNEKAKITFDNNVATIYGGAVFTLSYDFLFDDKSVVMFTNNSGTDGGAFYFEDYSTALVDGNVALILNENYVKHTGGAMCFKHHSSISFVGNSNTTFIKNSAAKGGALYSKDHCNVSVAGNATIIVGSNNATINGGALCTEETCSVLFGETSNIDITCNSAAYGGAMSLLNNSYITFNGHTQTTFSSNTATVNGGVIYSAYFTNVTFSGKSTTLFNHNTANQHGGVIYVLQSNIMFTETSYILFDDNTAIGNGGAMYLTNFILTFSDCSIIIFTHNTAYRHGSGMYIELIQTTQSKVTFNTTNIMFDSNSAITGSDVYLDMLLSCDDACLNSSIVGLQSNLKRHITTPPRKLVLRDPAICIDDDENATDCKIYQVNNIMLGQEIALKACVLDYYGQSTDATQFLVSGRGQYHYIEGLKFVSISCKELEGVNIAGSKVFSSKTNISVILTSRASSQSDLSTISVELNVQLSPCHPGFTHDHVSHRCICYNDSDIVFCSKSMSFIKEDYWFGLVGDTLTVARCPIGYCSFTCCAATDGFYQLTPMRTNQCSSHRSDTACGSCEEGYTLSFDSLECVSVDQCTTGQTVMVVTLSMIYWIVIVILVFIMTYYHVEIGYLYAFTYYYSMLDTLLDYNLYNSQGLFVIISITSSIAKVTPKMLGKYCLVQNISGIDQHFIHYIHPISVAILVAVIFLLSRISYKFSLFIHRNINHVLSLLLLLSYTSVATTSLLLLRSLTFDNVDKVYTYLSPDIEYWHGRHLPYFIVAVLCTIVIVIGLPILLLLEPFLNHKINFTRIKPLLDQFQGCYKDKYHCFAAYYMICRLFIIFTMFADSSVIPHLLIVVSLATASIHLITKPYSANILNITDGFVLEILTVLILLEGFDVIIFRYISVVLPFLILSTVALVMQRNEIINKITTVCVYCSPKPDTTDSINEIPMREYGIIVDESMRRNATICEM